MRALTMPFRYLAYQWAMLRWLRSFPDAAVMERCDYELARHAHALSMPDPRDWGLE